MKKILWSVLAILVLIIGTLWFFYALPSLRISTGYGAKYLGSYSCLSNLPDSIVMKDLNFSVVKSNDYEYNNEIQELKASFHGIVTQTAVVYNDKESFGCYLKHQNSDSRQKLNFRKADHNYTDFTRPWPVGDQLKDTTFPEVNLRKLNQIISETINNFEATRAVTICYKNQLIAEQYNHGVNINTRLIGWSMSKTMSGALIGNLEKNGLINKDDLAGIPAWENDNRAQITIHHLLQMSSGLKWEEDYTKISDVTRMLYLESDFVDYACSRSLKHKPGTHWNYSSGTTNILSGIIRSKFDSQNEYLAYLNDSLLNAINMRSAVMETDNTGNYVFSSYCWATARDWTRFGLLYLNQGNWFGHQVFTHEWVTQSTTPAPSSEGQYGYQLWLNNSGKQLPSAPRDAYFEKGYGGQRVVIIPSMDLVVVMLSGRQDDFDFDQFLAEVLNCFTNEQKQ